MKRNPRLVPAGEWLRGEINRSRRFRETVEEELAAINVAQDLAALREKRGLSQAQLARQLGVSQSAIAQLEGGRSLNVELRTLVRTALALGARVTVSIRSDTGTRRVNRRRPAHAARPPRSPAR